MTGMHAAKNYDLTKITRLLLDMRDNCALRREGEAYDDPQRAEKCDALNAAIDIINNPSIAEVVLHNTHDKVLVPNPSTGLVNPIAETANMLDGMSVFYGLKYPKAKKIINEIVDALKHATGADNPWNLGGGGVGGFVAGWAKYFARLDAMKPDCKNQKTGIPSTKQRDKETKLSGIYTAKRINENV